MVELSQASYIDKILSKYSMDQSKGAQIPFRHGLAHSSKMCSMTQEEKERTSRILYTSPVGSLMYAMLCTRQDIFFVLGMVSKY